MSSSASHESTVALDDLVSVLLTASRSLVAISARSLTEVEDMLTLSEFRALVVLDGQGSCGVNRLARRLGVSPETGERLAVNLAEGGFVRHGPDGVLELTAHGRGLVSRVTELRRIEIRRVVGQMDVDDRRILVDALIAFARAAGEPLVTEHDSGSRGGPNM